MSIIDKHISVPEKLTRARGLLNAWDEFKAEQPENEELNLILREMDVKNHVKVKDVQFETVSFGIDFRTYEQIQQLLLSEQIQKQKGYHHMLDQPPSFLRVVFDEANFFDVIKRSDKVSKKRKHRPILRLHRCFE
jgi:hypothetical protein